MSREDDCLWWRCSQQIEVRQGIGHLKIPRGTAPTTGAWKTLKLPANISNWLRDASFLVPLTDLIVSELLLPQTIEKMY
jgi:hypothetical protein